MRQNCNLDNQASNFLSLGGYGVDANYSSFFQILDILDKSVDAQLCSYMCSLVIKQHFNPYIWQKRASSRQVYILVLKCTRRPPILLI